MTLMTDRCERDSRALLHKGRLESQIPTFAVVGLIGYAVDATITYAGAKYGGLSPELARLPGFVVATNVNFLLNRAITFRHSSAPLVHAFIRYWVVASVGIVVNYGAFTACVLLAPRLGLSVSPTVLPLFVAVGACAAMVITFVGFRFFAFRS
jgi:putative flippase GtrA